MGNCLRPEQATRNNNNNNQRRRHNPFAVSPVPKPRILSKESFPRTHMSNKYSLGRELGRGNFGVTYLCTDLQTHETLACKSISKEKLQTPVDIEDMRREVAIMSKLSDNNPNIIKLRTTYEDDESVHLIMELCEGGTLLSRIEGRGHYTEKGAAVVTHAIAEVVKTCHENGVIHRDLKPDNFLFACNEELSLLKAIDFGISTFFKPGERFTEIVGTMYYTAPEMLKRNYGPEIDIWSAGVTLYHLLCGFLPFRAGTQQGVANAILWGSIDFRSEPWPQISESAKSLVRKMLEPEPSKRLTAQQVIEHPWIQQFSKGKGKAIVRSYGRY